MDSEKKSFKKGDIVKIKKGEEDPDFEGLDIGGWEGKITDFPEEGFVTLQLGADTILKMPDKAILDAIEKGLDLETMTLNLSDIEHTPLRPISQTAKRAAAAKLQLIELFEEKASYYREVFKDVNLQDEFEMYEKWESFLDEKLTFPFEVKVMEYQQAGPVQQGDVVVLKKLMSWEDPYGILGKGSKDGTNIIIPICELEATDPESDNHQWLEDYCNWYSNQ